jgi:hypothetical protein
MHLYNATANIILDPNNYTIIDLLQIENRTDYAVNTSQLFSAFVSPFFNFPVTVGIDTNESSDFYKSSLYNINNSANISFVRDLFVEGLVFNFASNGPGECPTPQLRGFLASAIGYSTNYNTYNESYIIAQQTYAFEISPVAMVMFTMLSAMALLLCILIAVLFPGTISPNMASISPEMTFAGKLEPDMLDGLSNATSAIMISRFKNVRIHVGGSVVNGKLSVVMSTEKTGLRPLERNVEYW